MKGSDVVMRVASDCDDRPLLVAVPQAARRLGISPRLAWDLVRSGALPSVRLGKRRRLVPVAALHRLAEDLNAGTQ